MFIIKRRSEDPKQIQNPKAPSRSLVSTWALKGLLHPNFGAEVWAMMVLGAFGRKP